MKPTTISKGFLFAGLSNILGVLIFSKFFTNEIMMNAQPDVMGYFGLISIVLWGLAYIAVRKNYEAVPWLIAVFMIEKLLYVIVYIRWFSTDALRAVYDQDLFAGIFYTIYGVNDFIFGLFFAWVFFTISKVKNV
ncbi:hypothetical protein [Cochleicola gelatinilyticus]|uniref:Uncharacterized protein n=1 Tax=Cochleicola gelatinilyticus TaxID=1763537 RepID=A0A167KFK2_9FLAO|nr:hypothetical protein [Cochleicola gelatinilyticus]OAB81839.1 hypothetical protein ULVI_00450 [Cochleicola gelatinilyticus]